MGAIQKSIIQIGNDAVPGIDLRFGRKMQIDVQNVPKKFKSIFDQTRADSLTQLKMQGIYESYEIEKIENNQIRLRSGEMLDSRMYAKMFGKSSELVFFLVSLRGYEELDEREENMLVKLFLDSWGSSIVEAGYDWLRRNITADIKDHGLYATNSFSPGQHDVPMHIQKIIFKKLEPGEIGVSLNDHFLMNPKKSISGVFGIGPVKFDNNLRPCDFCSLKGTCTDAYASDYVQNKLEVLG